MSFLDLRSFLDHLEGHGQLVRIAEEVDPNQEVTVIQHRVLAERGPALLFERVKGSAHRLVTNLFGSAQRVEMAFGRAPAELGAELAELASGLTPPSLGALWRQRRGLRRVLRARQRRVRTGPILAVETSPPDLERLPCLTCWPRDGGPFFTLGLVHTVDPASGVGNLGIYRLQRFDARSTGMHWQIEKGGGFHFVRACARGQSLPVSVFLGGPPALTIAAVAPLPEGVDERILAALMLNRPLEVIQRAGSGHRIPARAELVLEGAVRAGDVRREGPFGDHLGHYSHSAEFPVFRVERLLARSDAIVPATVVGKPPQEDYFIGVALQEMTLPILRLLKPAVRDLWAYPETGFHPLAVAAVEERYPREALKHAFSVLGEGQLSLTKVLIAVGPGVPVRDFEQVSRAVWSHLDPDDGLHLLAPTAQDTLDFTGPAMNTGSRLILLATPRDGRPLRGEPPPSPPKASEVHPDLAGLRALGPAFLIARLTDGGSASAVQSALGHHPACRRYLFHVLVSADVALDDPMRVLWGWFTRFDPLVDLHPASREAHGNRLLLRPPLTIDATWKEGYRRPVAFDPEVERRVLERWARFGIESRGRGR